MKKTKKADFEMIVNCLGKLRENIVKKWCGSNVMSGDRGAHPSPEMKPSSSYWLLKFVYLSGQ